VLPSATYGGILPETQAWLVQYTGSHALASVLPEDDDPAWDKTEVGSPAATVDNGVLELACADAASALRWWLDDTGYTNATGVVLEALVRVTASSAEADSGLLLEVRDGECQFVVFLRHDGVNILGQDDVAVDLSDGFRRIVLACRGMDCRLLVDGQWVQDGHVASLVEEQRIGFGTASGYGYATAEIAWVHARAFYSWETMPDGGFVMQIGPFDDVIEDLPAYDPADPGASLDPDDEKCCWRIYEVDHSATAQFTLAEQPVVYSPPGTYEEPLADKGVVVQVMAGTDGDGFQLLVMNMGYEDDLGYGYGNPDIPIQWTRKGLVTV
jgi:hypothetical protein